MSKREKYRNTIESILALLEDKRLDVHESETPYANEQRLMKYLLETQFLVSKTLLDTVEEKNDIINIPVNVGEMNNEVYDVISFATTFHYNETYDCSPSAIAKLEKALKYRKFIQHKELEDKIERYIAQYDQHHKAWGFINSNHHKWKYRLTVLSKVSVSGWEKLSDVPMYQRICDNNEILGLRELHMIANAPSYLDLMYNNRYLEEDDGDPITTKQFYDTLVRMRKHNVDKHEWWQIYLGSEIGWKPIQFRVVGDFKR